VRPSTDDEHQSYSLAAQDARLAAYISSQPGWRQAALLADHASGATTDGPGLHPALVAARAGVIDALLIPVPEADLAAEATRTTARTATHTHKSEPGVRAVTNLVDLRP
jgi:hypothetical protein